MNPKSLTYITDGMWRAAVIICGITAIALLSGCGSAAGGSKQAISPLVITTATLPNGVIGTSYSQTIQATGGVAPFNWTVSSGTLPHHLSLSSSNTNSVSISGTPDLGVEGLAFTIQVTDSFSQVAFQPYTVSVLLQPNSLVLSPWSLDYGDQTVGTASAVLTETLKNASVSDMAISNIGITGSNGTDFKQLSTTCGPNLAAGGSCTVNLSFTPTQAGPRTAAMTISDDAADSPQSASLNGTGFVSGPDATLSAVSLSFATQLAGTTSRPMSLTLNNYSTATLNITNIAATADFAETDNCIPSVLPFGTCTVAVTFTPILSGVVNGTLSLSDDAIGSPQTVALTGTGSSNTPLLTGQCFATCQGKTEDPVACPVGQRAKTPGQAQTFPCGPVHGFVPVDLSRGCHVSGFNNPGGHCVTQ